MDLSLSGLASGFDWKSVVDQLIQVERAPQTRLRNQQSTLNSQKSAVSNLVNELETLQNKAEALQEGTLYTNQLADSSDTEVATATASSSSPKGTYALNIISLATNASLRGTSGIGGGITAATAVTSSGAGFATTVTNGTFTVNGTVITIDGSQSLNDLMASMQSAIGAPPRSPTTRGRIRLRSTAPVPPSFWEAAPIRAIFSRLHGFLRMAQIRWTAPVKSVA